MNDAGTSVRCLLVPCKEIALLVPFAAVAEVTVYRLPESIPNAPAWLLGLVSWRAQSILLIAPAALLDPHSKPSPPEGKMVVVYGLQQPAERSFLGLEMTGTPRPLLATQRSLRTLNPGVDAMAKTWVRVQVEGVDAVVVDLVGLQALLSDHLPGGCSPTSKATGVPHRFPPLTAPSRGATDGG